MFDPLSSDWLGLEMKACVGSSTILARLWPCLGPLGPCVKPCDTMSMSIHIGGPSHQQLAEKLGGANIGKA